jgi:hypothetical protein
MTSYYLNERMFNLVRGFIINLRKTRRLPAALPVRFAILRRGRGAKLQKSRSISARTADLSRSGLSLETSVIQIDNFHVSISADMASEQLLEIELALPARGILIEGRPLRYERREATEGNYLVGVQITAMSDEDRAVYEEYLKTAERKL